MRSKTPSKPNTQDEKTTPVFLPSQILVPTLPLEGWVEEPNRFVNLLCSYADISAIAQGEYEGPEEVAHNYRVLSALAETGRIPHAFDDEVLWALNWGLSSPDHDDKNLCRVLLLLHSWATEQELDCWHLVLLLQGVLETADEEPEKLRACLGFCIALAKAAVCNLWCSEGTLHHPTMLFSVFLLQVAIDPFDPRLDALAVLLEQSEETVFQDLSNFTDEKHGVFFLRLHVSSEKEIWYKLADLILRKGQECNPNSQSIAWIHMLLQG